jgi:hypothetical protein
MFDYLLDKITQADIESFPYKHIEVNNFLEQEHLDIFINDDQLHFKPCSSDYELFKSLLDNQYEVFSGAGVTKDFKKYLQMLKNGEGIEGMGFFLPKPRNPVLKEFLEFFRSDKFHECVKAKFDVTRPTRLHSDYRKYLSRYQISPHPDMREKAMTYLLNLNKPQATEYDIHTKVMFFKKEYEWKYEEWENNPNTQREWVPWEWCEEHKSIKENNSIIIFSPNNRTLHGARLYYPHYDFQRTQLYGNLWYTDV